MRLQLLVTLVIAAFCGVSQAQEDMPVSMLEKQYRQAAYAFYNEDPYQAVLHLDLAAEQDARSLLLKAGLLLQIGMPQQAADVLEKVLGTQQGAQLPTELRQLAMLQYSRYLYQLGDLIAARNYLAKVENSDLAEGQQQQLQQLLDWPNIQVPAEPDFAGLAAHPEMPYIISNQLLQIAKNGDPARAMQWLDALIAEVDTTLEPMFWRRWFGLTPPWLATEPAEQQGVRDYLQVLKAQLFIQQQDFAAAQLVLSQFPQQSAFSEMALGLYAQVLDELRQVPPLLAVYQQRIRKHPFSLQSWQAANNIGRQLELSGEPASALAAYQWADDYYQQQLTANRALQPLTLAQLAKAELSQWQLYQVGQEPRLHQLQQDLSQLQQLAGLSPSQQKRLQHLQNVVQIKLDQQQQLLETQLPRLQASYQQLASEQQRLSNELTTQLQLPFAPALLTGDAFKQQQRVEKAERLLSSLSQAKAQGAAVQVDIAKQTRRLELLSGISHWQYAFAKADREWQIKKELNQINQLLPTISEQLRVLTAAGDATPRLKAQQQQLAALAQQQQQGLAAVNQQQQRLLAEFNQQLQQRADEQYLQLTELARINKQAMARMMEDQLQQAGPKS
jgi:hypothetical protein